MLLVALTGSIGTGKSTTASMFEKHGYAKYDADRTVHDIYTRDETIEKIQLAFPDSIVNGKIDRKILGQQVLSDREKLTQLEGLIHPLVREAEHQYLMSLIQKNVERVILEIPLLFETKGEQRSDIVVVTDVPPEVQRERVLARSGMSDEKLEAILSRQVSREEKIKKANYIVDTSKGIEMAEQQVSEIVKDLKDIEGSAWQKRLAEANLQGN